MVLTRLTKKMVMTFMSLGYKYCKYISQSQLSQMSLDLYEPRLASYL